jgi:hypothetical protein
VWGRTHVTVALSPVTPDAFGGTGGLSYSVALRFERDARGRVIAARMTFDGDVEAHLVRR